MTGIDTTGFQNMINASVSQLSGIRSDMDKISLQADILGERYVALLEQTNAQLDLGWAPMSIFISALGVLFAIGAIVAGFVIYGISKEFKERTNKLIERGNELIQNINGDYEKIVVYQKQKIAELDNIYAKEIESNNKELQKATTDAAKKEIEKRIAELKTKKEENISTFNNVVRPYAVYDSDSHTVDSSPYAYGSVRPYNPLLGHSHSHRCASCGNTYEVEAPNTSYSYMDPLTLRSGVRYRIKCPKCGAEELYK